MVNGSSPAASAPVLALRSLKFSWRNAFADCIDIDSFDMQPAERVFLHGPSGCGKSTLLALLGGVLVPRGGEIRLLDRGWNSLSPWARDAYRVAHIGYIFQQFNLLPYLSAMENVELPCRLSRRREQNSRRNFASSRRQAEHLLNEMELERTLWKRTAAELSVGQQQRVAAARALIGLPELVLADEPTSALDEERRAAFLRLLLQMCVEAGSALVFVSHDKRLAAHFDRQVSLPTINRAPAAEQIL